MIRKARFEDLPGICVLCFGEYMEEVAYRIGQNFNFMPLMAELGRIINDDNLGVLLVAEEEDSIRGFVLGQFNFFVADLRQPICHEVGWYVEPHSRGKGLGTELMRTLETEAQKKGVGLQSLGRAVDTENSDYLDTKYKEWGYRPFQVVYFKQLENETQ